MVDINKFLDLYVFKLKSLCSGKTTAKEKTMMVVIMMVMMVVRMMRGW